MKERAGEWRSMEVPQVGAAPQLKTHLSSLVTPASESGVQRGGRGAMLKDLEVVFEDLTALT